MAKNTYQPELGQAIFGQPSKQFAVSPMLEAALLFVQHELDRVLWNRLQVGTDSPFGNTGAKFDTKGLSIHAYSWGDDDQPWNLKYGNLEVSWYKYFGRGMSVNRNLSNDEVSNLLDEILTVIRDCDTRAFGSGEPLREFSYE
jgi:hypothetical protein